MAKWNFRLTLSQRHQLERTLNELAQHERRRRQMEFNRRMAQTMNDAVIPAIREAIKNYRARPH